MGFSVEILEPCFDAAFFLFPIVIITKQLGIDLHPMNYFFLAASFFTFNLPLVYLVDQFHSLHIPRSDRSTVRRPRALWSRRYPFSRSANDSPCAMERKVPTHFASAIASFIMENQRQRFATR